MEKMQGAEPDKSRLSGLDGLRGVAIALVLLHHFHSYLLIWWPQGGGLADGVTARVLNFLWIGVDLFYVLSGFFISKAVLSYRVWDPEHYAKRRLTRIIPAYYVSMLLTLVILESHMFQNWQGWTNIGLHLLMLHHWQSWSMFGINGPYWTLGIEFSYYLLMLALAPWWRGPRGWLLVPAFMVIALVWRSGVFHGVPEADRFFWSVQLPGALDEFAWGMLVAYALHKNWFAALHRYAAACAALIFVVGVALVAFCLYRYTQLNVNYWTQIWHVVFSRTVLCLGFSLLLICLLLWREGNPLQILIKAIGLSKLGVISFSVYLYHIPVMIFVYRYYGDLIGGNLLFVFICFVGIIIFSWLSYQFIEKRWHPSA